MPITNGEPQFSYPDKPVACAGDLLSIVVPAFNEQEVLPAFHERLSKVLDSLPLESEVIYVNDGSRDGTMEVMKILRAHDDRVAILDLSRNFGKEIAMTAGLDHARGSAVVVIDADLQDPPELITELVKYWRDGWDMVYAQRIERRGETVLKKLTAHWFYRLMQRVGRVRIPENVGDYRLLSRRAVDALLQLREQHRFMKGLFAWIGFPQIGVPYHRDPRFAGRSTWDYWRLVEFRPRWNNIFHHHSAEMGNLSGPHNCLRVLHLQHCYHPAENPLRKPGKGLSVPDGCDPVPGRGSADFSRHHR